MPNKRTHCFLMEPGETLDPKKHVRVGPEYPDHVRTKIGAEFWIGQTRYAVVSINDDVDETAHPDGTPARTTRRVGLRHVPIIGHDPVPQA